MGYMETFDNEFVGYFGGLPVFHPLVDIADPEDCQRDAFGCGPETLVIGGGVGDGEHRAVVVLDAAAAVLSFVHAWREWYKGYDPDVYRALTPTAEALPDAPDRRESNDWWGVLDFAGWGVEDYVNFDGRCKSRAFNRPFAPDRDGILEAWLGASVGEFILLAMPELCRELTDQLGALRARARGCPLYENILLVPPGYSVRGRRERDDRITWGVSAWRVERNPGT